ncbi:MAG: nuclear transport factor 2 family protein [Woeseiaceae bacterium]|nr:nuclear transport factor 2 family protein [Woeseiaceae bacterium]
MNRFLLPAILLALAAPVAADLETEVRCREIAFSQSAENRDAEAFRTFLDADTRFIGNKVLRGPDEVVAGWSDLLSPGGAAIKWRPRIVEVLKNGRYALSRGPYRIVARDEDGNPAEHWGTFNSVWRLNDDGVWRVVFDSGSQSESPPDEAVQALVDAENNCE